jgi:hypothetical protein
MRRLADALAELAALRADIAHLVGRSQERDGVGLYSLDRWLPSGAIGLHRPIR